MQGTIDLRPAISGSVDTGVWTFGDKEHNFQIVTSDEYLIKWAKGEAPDKGKQEIEKRIVDLVKQFFGDCNTKQI